MLFVLSFLFFSGGKLCEIIITLLVMYYVTLFLDQAQSLKIAAPQTIAASKKFLFSLKLVGCSVCVTMFNLLSKLSV